MKTKMIFIFGLVFVFCIQIARALDTQVPQTLRIITVNVWSGSDYQGLGSFGMWESEGVRGQRYQMLIDELKARNPDVVLLQEVNPVRRFSRRIAKDLDMDEIHQVCIGGIKVFGLGIPRDFQEGNTILAKKELNLTKLDDWKLSGGPGIFSDHLTFHFDQNIAALVGQIILDGKPVNLVNVHLVAIPEDNPQVEASLNSIRETDSLTVEAYWKLHDLWVAGVQRRQNEVGETLKKISNLDPDTPLILGGDINATSGTEEMRRILELGNFTDTAWKNPNYVTWDAANNSNTYYSQGSTDARGRPNTPAENFSNLVDHIPRRIDYILINKAFLPEDALGNEPILTQPQNNIFASDHYGVQADVSTSRALAQAPGLFNDIPPGKWISFTVLPIVMYDTDTGIGYGGKGFVSNVFRANESFDLLIFNSTKSERWYKLEVSLPDKEIRQRKKYLLAADFKLEYDLIKEARFFGTGPESELDAVETYEKLPIEASLAFTHPFNRYLNAQLGFRYKYTSYTPLNDDPAQYPLLTAAIDQFGAERAYLNPFVSVRWDSRDSVVNPSRGFCYQQDLEMFNHLPFLPGIEGAAGKESFFRHTASASYYTQLWYPKTVLALRAMGMYQDDPVGYIHSLLALGGGWTLRGAPLERYLDNTAICANAELRFPLVWGLGGILGFDLGQIAPSPKELRLANWVSNPVAGLRYTLSNFVVRLDFGFGKDYLGLYFNFGHVY
jgi:endonuclease/exonuclease/phosphatase family metal-dependent hydrolase